MRTVSGDRRRDAMALLGGVTWGAVAGAVLVYAAFERATYARILNLDTLRLTREESWLLPATVVGTTLLVLAPAVAVAAVLGWTRSRRSTRIGLGAGMAVASAFLFADLGLYASIGRHIRTLVAFARLPEGRRAAGDLGSWALDGAQWLIAAALFAALVTALAEGIAVLARRRTLVAAMTLLAGATAYAALGIVPVFWTVGWSNAALEERLFGALPWDARWSAVRGASAADPALERLHRRLETTYRDAYAFLLAPKPVEPIHLTEGARRPNVLFIVLESWRSDALEPTDMPRLSKWAAGGLRLSNHYSASNHSEAGMFALSFGRSPLVYHATLDIARDPVGRGAPQMCQWLRGVGYDCGYFTGQPEVWMRLEEFLNPRSMDVYRHDDRGDWPEWDRRALGALVERAHARTRPLFGIVFLMSTHFEYRYPAEYERHRPVATSRWLRTSMTALGGADELPHRNRYRNALAFMDDAIGDALDALDPADNLVVLAGDHGESLFDDGRYGHGYSFADIVARTPCVIRGPGINPGTRTDLTLHTDVAGLVLDALGAKPFPPRHFHGQTEPAGSPRPVLLAYPSPNRDVAEVLLIAGTWRLRMDLGLVRPDVRVLGFEDALGRLTATPHLDDGAIAALDDAFRRELDAASR